MPGCSSAQRRRCPETGGPSGSPAEPRTQAGASRGGRWRRRAAGRRQARAARGALSCERSGSGSGFSAGKLLPRGREEGILPGGVPHLLPPRLGRETRGRGGACQLPSDHRGSPARAPALWLSRLCLQRESEVCGSRARRAGEAGAGEGPRAAAAAAGRREGAGRGSCGAEEPESRCAPEAANWVREEKGLPGGPPPPLRLPSPWPRRLAFRAPREDRSERRRGKGSAPSPGFCTSAGNVPLTYILFPNMPDLSSASFACHHLRAQSLARSPALRGEASEGLERKRRTRP